MLDQKLMSEIQRTLEEREHTTLEQLNGIKESTVQPALDGSIGRLTHIDAHQNRQIALHGQRRLEQQLELIRGALARVNDGTYGTCLQCGAAIAPERLEYMPEVPFCTPCQHRMDREGRA